jgi:hypothetical protein
VLWHDPQLRQCELHCTQSSVIDVQPVDLLDFDQPDANRDRLLAYFDFEAHARLVIQRFRIVDAPDLDRRRKYNRSRDNRARQRTHSDFIHTGDVHDALFPEQALEVQHRLQAKAFLPLLLRPLAKHAVQLLRTQPRVALQLAQQLTRNGDRRISILFSNLVEGKVGERSRHAGIFARLNSVGPLMLRKYLPRRRRTPSQSGKIDP